MRKKTSAPRSVQPQTSSWQFRVVLHAFFSLSKLLQSMRMVLAIRLFEFRRRKDISVPYVRQASTMYSVRLRSGARQGETPRIGETPSNQPISELDIFSKRQALSPAVERSGESGATHDSQSASRSGVEAWVARNLCGGTTPMPDSARAESGARADWQACTTHAFILDHRTICTVFRAIVVFAMTIMARSFTTHLKTSFVVHRVRSGPDSRKSGPNPGTGLT